MIGRAVRCSSGRPSPWAARSFPVLIGAAAVLIGAGRGQKKSQGGRRRPFTLAFSFLLLIEAGRVLPGADRGRGRRALVPAAPDPPARGTRHGSRWHRSRAAQFRRRMIRQNAAGRRGQILHLTAYRPIGNGELGSMPPYYPPLSPLLPRLWCCVPATRAPLASSGLEPLATHTLVRFAQRQQPPRGVLRLDSCTAEFLFYLACLDAVCLLSLSFHSMP